MAERWLIAAYLCSGFAGLTYEIAWTRLLTLHLGHTTAAISTVTAAFMGGLGIGAAVGGRLAARLSRRQALWSYAMLELVVALVALLIAGSVSWFTPVFAWTYGEDGSGPFFSIARISCTFALLLVPGVALGATFPMAVRVAVCSPTRPGAPAGRLYAANTAGAAAGALATGFFLIPILGLTGTTMIAMTTSAASIALALNLARSGFSEETTEESVTPRAKQRVVRHKHLPQHTGRLATTLEYVDTKRRYWLAVTTLALTGFATFVYEVAWARVLAMVVGPSIYAVAAALTSFITGLALGAFAGASLAARSRHPVVTIVWTLIATAAAACVSVAFVGRSYLAIGVPVSESATVLGGIPLSHLGIAVGLTLPIALGLGIAFPLSLELAGSRDAIPARRLGILYGVNTTAAVIGALAAGFIAIPFIGLRGCLLLATTSLLLGATVLAVHAWSARGRIAALLAVLAVASWMALSPGWDREWMAAGGYLYTRFVPPGVDRRGALTAGTLLYYREGAAGTVSVKALTGDRSLSIDGKVDASTSRDMLTQRLLAHLPLLLHPNPQEVGIVGLGSGITLASALVHPIVSADVVEISPEVVEASAYFANENRRALDDFRARLVRGDGRTHLSLTSRRYDVVISEPSNPWMAGVATLFTQEFFQTVRDRLSPGGIFCQWAHTYDVSDADLRSIVATFHSVFPDGTMWLAGDGDLLLVGSQTSLEPRLDSLETAWQRPGVADDLRTVGMHEPFALLSLFVGGPNEMARYSTGAIIQTDDRTALEFSGPLAIFDSDQINHAGVLRALLDDGRRPVAVARALTGATASEWRNRAGMMIAAEAFQSAYRDYTIALELDPTDESTLEGFVRAATAARREEDAERRLRSMIESHDAEPAPRVALAELLGIAGRFDEAVAVAADATRLAPGYPSTWEQLASLHTDRGDVDGLAPAVDVLRREFPHRATTWYFAASERFLRGDVAAALPLVRRAIDLDADYADAYNLLGAIHGTAGETSTSRDAFRTSLRLDPGDAITYINLAELELAAGQREVAAGLFAEALSLDPHSAPAREGLARAK